MIRFTPNQWFHVVFNYFGPEPDEKGYTVYHNGDQVTSQFFIENDSRAPQKDAEIVIGRRFTGVDGFYSSLIVDELLFFNRDLSGREITNLQAAILNFA